ncbi:helix-turn-helix domain-containing protein [Metabacillus halosaccharovorans]|uniref:helix-turn-helix domain-containing protein n=1 Tax=Metabacillus halosaccharovorans TaxID=930124 RepID=UPI00147509A9|nr:helix-turn-helix transcriptional regulator [Metabacillus halosaccharovorans]
MYYSEGISVNDVAKYVGINRTHFSNVFTKKIGISPTNYIQRKVMEKAAQLLEEHTNSMTEIALSLYYSDVYSFSRSFKNYYGISPYAYREEKMRSI